MKPIVRNIKNWDLYQYNGDDNFTNIRTGVGGNVTPDAAKENFRINVEATSIINEYPIVGELIKRLQLKMDKTDNP